VRSLHADRAINLEDETGMLNIICSIGLFLGTKRTVSWSPALLIPGILERGDGGVVSFLSAASSHLIYASSMQPAMPTLDAPVVGGDCDDPLVLSGSSTRLVGSPSPVKLPR
jgi:hypothetical protein